MSETLYRRLCVFVLLVVLAISESFVLAKEKYNPFDTNLVAKTPLSLVKGSYIPIGTKIKVALAEDVHSKSAVKGQMVKIVTHEDICVDDVCVIPTGSVGIGKIYDAVPARSRWRTARLEIIGVELESNCNFGGTLIPVPITNGIKMVEKTEYAYDKDWEYEKPTLVRTKKGGTLYVQRGAFGQSLGMLIKSAADLGEIGEYYSRSRSGGLHLSPKMIFFKGAEIFYPKGTEFYVLVKDNVDLHFNASELKAQWREQENRARMEKERRRAEQEERARIERSTEPVMPETTIK